MTAFPTRAFPLSVAALAAAWPAQAAFAQRGGTIRGTVTDAESRTPIIGARVAISAPERVAITNERGAYVLRDVPAGAYVVRATAIGHAIDSGRVTVGAPGAATLDVALAEGSLLLPGVVVSATRTPVAASKLAATVNVLTPEQVRQNPAREAQDLLREIPAVELPRMSSLVGGTAQIVSIRGVDEGRTAVLFDGIPVNDAWGEWIDWGRVPKGMIDRVEVVEGGTSSLYGNGAMGGLISFYSRPMSPGAATVQVDGGSRDAHHVYAAAGVPLAGALTASVYGDYQARGGYVLTAPANRGPLDVASNVIQRNAYARLTYAPTATFSAFATGHLFGDSRDLGTPLTFAKRDQRNVDLGLDYGALATGVLTVRAWNGRQIENQRSSAIRSATLRNAEDSSLTAVIPSHDWGGSAQWTRGGLLGLESFSVGADYRHYQGNFDEVDFNTTCPGANCGAVTRRVSSGGTQSLGGGFVQAIAAPVAPLRVELSARVDNWKDYDAHSTDAAAGATTYPDKSRTAFSPRLGVQVRPFASLAIHGAVYRAFRAPNLAELYRKQISATQVTIPNPELAAETALGREVGVDFQPVEQLQVKGTYYVAEYNDFNVPVTLTGADRLAACGTVATCRQRRNINASRAEGVEAYVAVRPLRTLFLSGGVSWDDARQVSGLPAGTPPERRPHINRVPSPRQTIRGAYTSRALGELTGIWRHEGVTTTLQGVPLAPFTVVDASYRRPLVPGLTAFVAVENIGNTRYQINRSNIGTTAAPLYFISEGLPRTVRGGVEAFRF